MKLNYVLCAIAAGCLAWAYARAYIAAECVQDGAFFVGKETFKCELLRPEPQPPKDERADAYS